MLTYAYGCLRMLTNAYVSSLCVCMRCVCIGRCHRQCRMLTYAYVCLQCTYAVCVCSVCVYRLMPQAMGGAGMNLLSMMLTYALSVYALCACVCSLSLSVCSLCVYAVCVCVCVHGRRTNSRYLSAYVLCVCVQADAAGNGGGRHESYGHDGQDDGRCHAGVYLPLALLLAVRLALLLRASLLAV